MVPTVPDGFFTKLLIQLRPCYSHMDFTVFAAALYGRGHKARLFFNPIETKKGEKGDVRSVVKFNIITSTQRKMDQIQSYMRELQQFFPGMCVIDCNGNLSRDIKLVDRSFGAKESTLMPRPHLHWV